LTEYDASIIIPAFNESNTIQKTLRNLNQVSNLKLEIVVVVDSLDDNTISSVSLFERNNHEVRVLVQDFGPGPANAIRYGLRAASSRCLVIMMADGSDDVRSIPELANLIGRGVSVACASRYMPGGQQIGGPRLKKFLSKGAGQFLYLFAGIGTHDPTNSFKAYSRDFIESIQIESRSGFEVGIELVAKAHILRKPIAEIPTIWLDRMDGVSNFKMTKWIPKYLRWFLYCFKPKRILLPERKGM
jgi:dolichol-phosphate mannosyltransferase